MISLKQLTILSFQLHRKTDHSTLSTIAPISVCVIVNILLRIRSRSNIGLIKHLLAKTNNAFRSFLQFLAKTSLRTKECAANFG